MDIAALSMGMSQSSLSLKASVAIYKKVLDTTNENNESLIKSMELSANPNLGSNLDIRA
jgi:hypothetical protein